MLGTSALDNAQFGGECEGGRETLRCLPPWETVLMPLHLFLCNEGLYFFFFSSTFPISPWAAPFLSSIIQLLSWWWYQHQSGNQQQQEWHQSPQTLTTKGCFCPLAPQWLFCVPPHWFSTHFLSHSLPF